MSMFKTIRKSAEIINVEEAYDQRIVNLWNNLPSSTTDFTSFHKFDKSLNNDYLLLYN